MEGYIKLEAHGGNIETTAKIKIEHGLFEKAVLVNQLCKALKLSDEDQKVVFSSIVSGFLNTLMEGSMEVAADES